MQSLVGEEGWKLDVVGYSSLFGAPALLFLCCRALFINLPFAAYLALAIMLTFLLYFVPLCEGCRQGSVTYLRKPNPVISIFDDARSRHWIERAG